jgi:hypothetical protein
VYSFGDHDYDLADADNASYTPEVSMPLPRISIAALMVVVATVAIALSGYLKVRRLTLRRNEYVARAKRHDAIAEFYRRHRGIEPRTAAVEFHAARARRYAAEASRY